MNHYQSGMPPAPSPLSGGDALGTARRGYPVSSAYWAVMRATLARARCELDQRIERSSQRMFARLERHPARGI